MSAIDMAARHYRRLMEPERTERDHPADRLVASSPHVAAIDHAVRTKATEMSSSVAQRSSTALWTEYEDLRFQQRCLREERFFDLGFEMGRLAGIADDDSLVGEPEASELRTHVLRIIVSTGLPRETLATVMLEVARSLLNPGRTGSPAAE